MHAQCSHKRYLLHTQMYGVDDLPLGTGIARAHATPATIMAMARGLLRPEYDITFIQTR